MIFGVSEWIGVARVGVSWVSVGNQVLETLAGPCLWRSPLTHRTYRQAKNSDYAVGLGAAVLWQGFSSFRTRVAAGERSLGPSLGARSNVHTHQSFHDDEMC